MTRLPSPSRPTTSTSETRTVTRAHGRAFSARATATATAMVSTVAMVAMVAGSVPTLAHAAPADIDTNYQGGPADIDTNYQDGSAGSARALTQQGQAAFDSGDYMGAAGAWKKILDILPENDLNREERENALLISLEAYKQAYRRVTLENSSATNGADLLREALRLCDAYTKEVGRVHGPTGVSPAVVESRVEIEGMLANDGGGSAQPRTPIITPSTPGVVLEPDVIRRGKSGTGLIAGGSVAIVVGLAMMPLVIIGARRLKDANSDLQDARSEGNQTAIDNAEDQKSSANAMIISGSILMGVLTIGGATMLGIGIRRRIRYTAFAPQIGPSYAGLSLLRKF